MAKRLRTPSPVRDLFDEELKALLLYKSRMKYATVAPQGFLPSIIFNKFPELTKEYKAVIDSDPFDKDLTINKHAINDAIEKLKELFIHSFVISQENNWVFITQIESYHKEKDLDDVAIISKLDQYPDKLTINMEKFQEGKGSWYELRFVFKKFEIIATGGICNDSNSNKLNAFLGVAAPPILALDTKFILFSTVQPAKTRSCPRMLRNYGKKASLNPWCIKSLFFSNINFSTPEPLNFYENEPVGYVSVCSKLLYLTTYKTLSITEINRLTEMMVELQYWKDLGFDNHNVEKDEILAKLNQIKQIKKPRDRKPSEAKRLLIELLFNYSDHQISENSLITLYNGILYPKVKNLNKQRVKMMLKR